MTEAVLGPGLKEEHKLKSAWERLANSRAKFEVEVPAERVAQAMDAAYRKLVKRVNVPGFRKGKAPRPVLERYVGRAALFEEAVDIILPEAYGQAVQDSGLEPLDRPSVEIVKADEGEPLVFKAEVPVKPEVVLGEYRDLEVPMPQIEVTEEQVDKNLQAIAEQHAQLVAHEGPAEMGHYVVIDFEGALDGKPFAGGAAKGYQVHIGSGQLIAGFEENLVGMLAGEEREFNLVFPQGYQAEHLAGKEIAFKVRMNEVKRKEVPPVDDELAKLVGPFQSLQELRSDLTNKLRQAAAEEAQRKFEEAAVEAVVERAAVELPEVLVHRQMHRMMDEMQEHFQQQGMTLELMLRATGKTMDDLHEEMRAPAAKAVKTELVLEEIAKREGLTVTRDEAREELDRYLAQFGEQAEQLRTSMLATDTLDRVQAGMLRDKTVKHLAGLQKAVPAATTETDATETE